MHSITPTGSGTEEDPYVYVIPDGIDFTGSGVIKMNDKYVAFDFSSGTGGLDMAAGSYFDLTGSDRNEDPGECTIILGNNSLTGFGKFITDDISKDSMDVNIIGSGDVTVTEFYMRVSDARAGALFIDVGGSVNIGSVDTHDRASGGGDGGDVTIHGADITIGDIDTRSLRTSSSNASSGDVVLEARDYVGTSMLNNTVNSYGVINTNSATGTDGDVTIRGVVVTLESGFSATAGDGSLNIYAGIVQYGKTATDLFIDNSGGGYSATHSVPWTGPGAEFYASEPSPNPGTEDVCPVVTLGWTKGILASSHDVYIGTDFNDVNDADSTYYPNVDYNNVDVNHYTPGPLLSSATYYWRVDEVNEPNLWTGPIWQFTTDKGTASNPSPTNDTAGVPVDTNLSWTRGCVASSHDVYIGTDFNDVNDANYTFHPNVDYDNVDVNTFDPGLLSLGTTYYWRVDQVNDPYPANVWVGTVWRFEVEDGKATDPSPANRTFWQPVDATLSWTTGALATSHDVYFGTDFDDVNDADSTYHPNVDYDNVDVNNYNPGSLALGTTYYWRVDEVSATTYVKGDIWRFTTVGILHLKVDLGLPMCGSTPDNTTTVPGTVKEGWWGRVFWGDTDMYMHDFAWEDGSRGSDPPATPGVAGSGVHFALDSGTGDGGYHVHGLCRDNLGGGGCPTGIPVGDPIANGWFHNIDWGGECTGDIHMRITDLPAGRYELISYHNHWEPCSQGTRNCLDCTSNMPPMTAVYATSLPVAGLPGCGVEWSGTGTGVTSLVEAYNIDVTSVLTDADVATSTIEFETDGSDVLVVYDGGNNDYPDPARPGREGSKGILNAFELKLKPLEHILEFIDTSVANGAIEGSGPGKSASNRLNALINMFEATSDLIAGGYLEDACGRLTAILKKCDGQVPPPDFISGEAVEELADMILQLMEDLECE
ncbi:MAG: hypothetical protein ACYSTF_04705 [Planctomycetota bacterium]|jgi:hypothetical protein